MFEKPTSTHVLGLDLDGFFLKGVSMSFTRGKLKLDHTFDILLEKDEEGHVKPLYMPDQKNLLDAYAQKDLIVTTANAEDVLVRPLELKITKEKDVDAALPFQIEPLLPYPIENAMIDKVFLSKDKEGSKLCVFCIRKDHLTRHIEQWNALEINPEVVTADPQALILFANRFVKKENPYFVLHLGIGHSFCVLTDQGKLLAAQAIPTGLEQFIEALIQAKGIDRAAAYAQLFQLVLSFPTSNEIPGLKNACDHLRMTITRTLYSLAKTLKGAEIKEILITGPGAIVEGLSEFLCSQFHKELIELPEIPELNTDRKTLLNYALPIGAALNALPKNKDALNFRQLEFSYPEPWKRLKHPIFLYFLLCFGIAAALFLFEKSYRAYREAEVKQHYLQLLTFMNKSYSGFEKEFTGNPNMEPRNPKSLNLEEIQSRLNFLEKGIQSLPQNFPLQPNTPLVSDVLAWISSHPNFVGKKQNDHQEAISPMQIKSFSYNMVKRPEPTKKQERYQVKVEMEFSSPTPKMAREFHDALIAPNDMVDAKGEIKWSSNRDLYRTSFYLKDKTAYPNL